MYKRILVPLDGSDLSAGVLPYIRWLGPALKVPVELLHVNDPDRLARSAPSMQHGDYLKKVAASFPQFAGVKCSVVAGNPAQVIIDSASAMPETLIAMATHGYSGAIRWLLGSVAEKVFQAATSDLLLVRPEAPDQSGAVRLEKLLVALDGSEAAEKVLAVVSEMADQFDLEILLVHVTKHFYAGPPEAILPVFGAVPNLKELWEQDKIQGNKYLSEKEARLRAQGIAHLSTRLLEGGVDGAAGEIVDLAQKIPGSLIAMTSHGHTGIGRWLVGSVTRRVVQHSRRPVLVVRSQS